VSAFARHINTAPARIQRLSLTLNGQKRVPKCVTELFCIDKGAFRFWSQCLYAPSPTADGLLNFSRRLSLDGVPDNIDRTVISNWLADISGVRSVHNLHI